MKLYFCLLFMCISSLELVGQEFKGGYTANITKKPTHVTDKNPSRDRLFYLIKNNPKNTLVGNKCMEEVTEKMGFKYLLQPKGQPGNRHEFERLMHNFGVKAKIFFKNGPFWKSKLKKRKNECMASTGDYTG